MNLISTIIPIKIIISKTNIGSGDSFLLFWFFSILITPSLLLPDI
jgi:hypothetical protein